MLRQFAVAVLLSGLAFAQSHTPVGPHFEQLDDIRKIDCKVPEGFGCAIIWDLDVPGRGNMIASVVGGVVRQISLILDHTMYIVVYDPPLERDDRMRRKTRVPARVDGDNLIIQWPDGTEAKGRIVKREKIDSHQPQPA